MLKGKWM